MMRQLLIPPRVQKLGLTIGTLLLAGCQLLATDAGETVMATQLFVERDCPITLPGPYPATAIYANIDDLGIANWQKTLRGTDAENPDRMLVLVHIGQQPSPGHRISLQSARVRNTDLVLDVTRRYPDPNRMYAQVITHPCILVSVPTGNYNDIDVNEVDAPGA